MRSETKQLIVAGQRPGDRSAPVLFLAKMTDTRAGRKLESGLDVLLREVEITTGGRSTLARLSMFDPTSPHPSWRNGLSVVSICPDMFDDNISSWLSVTSQRQYIFALSMVQMVKSVLVRPVTLGNS